MKFINSEITKHIATISLNRPDQANALSLEFFDEIKNCFESLSENPEVHCIIIKGEGKHFCSGIDLSCLKEITTELMAIPQDKQHGHLVDIILKLQSSFNAIANAKQPVIAAIHGACIGGGVDMIAACDIRFATSDATFSIKEADYDIIADLGTLQRLPYIIGEGITRELAYTAREFNGTEAKDIGLINCTFDDASALFEHAHNTAKNIARKSAGCTQGIKQVLSDTHKKTIKDGLINVAKLNAQHMLNQFYEG